MNPPLDPNRFERNGRAVLPSLMNGSLTPADAGCLAMRLLANYPLDAQKDVREYEKAVAKFIGVRHAFALGACRMALFVLLRALGLGVGDEVILPGYTCVVIPNAIRFASCTPIYADISLADFNTPPAAIEAAITPRTRAVIVQHTFGIPSDLDAIQAICRRHHLIMIEDGAHALGGLYAGRPLGQFGKAAVFSSERHKMISTDKGGVLVTDDPALAGLLQSMCRKLPLRNNRDERFAAMRVVYDVLTMEPALQRVPLFSELLAGILRRTAQYLSGSANVFLPCYDRADYQREEDGMPCEPYPRRLAGILCKIGRVQMARLGRDVMERNAKAAVYERLLPRFGARVPVYDKQKCRPSFVRYPFLVDDRPRWAQALARLGLRTGQWLDDPLHPQQSTCHELNNYKWGSCPQAEYAAQHVINIPVGRTVTEGMIRNLAKLHL